MRTLLVLGLALLTVGCVPRVPIRIPARVPTAVPKIPTTVPKLTPVVPHVPPRLPTTTPILKRTVPGSTVNKSERSGFGLDNLPFDQLFPGTDDDKKPTPTPLPRTNPPTRKTPVLPPR